MQPPVTFSVSEPAIAAFCRRWKIEELAVFGSLLRDDFGPQSDIDLLATFAPNANWSLLDPRMSSSRMALRIR